MPVNYLKHEYCAQNELFDATCREIMGEICEKEVSGTRWKSGSHKGFHYSPSTTPHYVAECLVHDT